MLQTGKDLVLSFAERSYVAYLSGRRESCREATLSWITRNGLPWGNLLMRSENDYRKAAVLKPELIKPLPFEQVLIVVDDDPLVCDALSAAGYRVLQATWARAKGA